MALAGLSLVSTLRCVDDRKVRVAGLRDGSVPVVVGNAAIPEAGTEAGNDRKLGLGIPINPDANGYFDGSNAAGVVGAWWAIGDDYGPNGVAGAGDCPMAGFPDTECSRIYLPTPGAPFRPSPSGMCARGSAAQVIGLDGGPPDYSVIWGNTIGFGLNYPMAADVIPDSGMSSAPSDASVAARGQYDAPARGVTGIAFDIDTPPPGNLRVEFQTLGTENSSAYWGGAAFNNSPVFSGHNEIRWADVGGPVYLPAPPPFDATKLEAVQFHVPSGADGAINYMYCVNNIVMLTN
jgi:hypothetical protein